jgi:hypothetical protein
VFKNVPGYGDSITDPNQIVNTFAHSALQKRNLTIRLALPGKVLRHNADSVQWSDATWTIPMTAIAATAQPELVAWAEMPALASDRWVGMAAPLWYRFSGQAWRNPDTLPEFVVAPGDGPS